MCPALRVGCGPATGLVHEGSPDGQRGGATVLLLALGLVLVLFGTFGAAIVLAGMADQRAMVAADLGALAGAARALDGDMTACASAADIVARNAGRMVGCHLDGLDVLVTVEVAFTPLPGLTRVATSTARAGPVRA
ncbi:Rv3654c family TadE-like protein [Micromonospora chokoriensis]|uniref:Helicase/secretion neighborhood TadE-like protein n=1 Tax=Micromonospora chokoriensis TaxID=356851 RepID=A0A1C4UXL2_9ACTN|nr:Rv3654c family TadE-like protein [Micromonospora chokoriensis]SCE76450.1 helicase/secretion neighborhood TadE-like protein [Micromonospora chokoriensis]